jgi:hypothetical protein
MEIPMAMKKTFTCTLGGAGPNRAFPYLEAFPFDTVAIFGTKGRVPVKVTIGGVALATSIAPMGGRHVLAFSGPNAKKLGIKVGDTIRITIEKDNSERIVEVPPDLAKALKGPAKQAWDALAYSHKKELALAIAEAKQPETRARRIAKTIAMLATTSRPVPPTPSKQPLAKRLRLKPEMKVALFAAPADFDLEFPTTTKTPADVALVFVANRAALAKWLPKLRTLAPLLFLAYPKTTSALESDLTRDAGWDPVEALGFVGNGQVAIDETWSALRFARHAST